MSRKITKLRTSKQTADLPNIVASARNFVENFRNKYKNFDPYYIRNTDQSGFNLELYSGRTLETVGTRTVEANIQATHSATHSYTIMPQIAASGELVGPLFIILQEAGGVFGEIVQRTMFKHADIFVVCSKSGKITNGLMDEWFLRVFFPSAGHNSVLIVDSLNTYKNRQNINRLKPAGVQYQVEMLPPHTTPIAQPLDRYFFRPYKSFVRRISEYANMHHREIRLPARDNILKLQVVVYNFFRSPRFNGFLKCSFELCGYFPTRTRHVSPMEYCFGNVSEHWCILCPTKPAFVRCSWCAFYYCFEHFFLIDQFHYCKNYIEWYRVCNFLNKLDMDQYDHTDGGRSGNVNWRIFVPNMTCAKIIIIPMYYFS